MSPELDFDVPSFGLDLDRVVAYSTADQPIVGRLFVPLETSVWGAYQSWTDAARIAAVELTATTRWTDIRAAAAQRAFEVGRPQVGTINRQAIQTLVSVLGRVVSDTRQTRFALWGGYGGEIDAALREEIRQIPKRDRGSFLSDGSYVAIQRDIDWAVGRSLEAGFRFPVAMWSPTLDFVVAAPIYQDSYYVTCGSEIFEGLRAGGLEVLEIDRELVLPSEGD